MTSPRRRQDRPIESVALKITFRAGGDVAARIKEIVPRARLHGGVCEVNIGGEEPGEVAEKARLLLEKLKAVV
jgi:hypothetical protein